MALPSFVRLSAEAFTISSKRQVLCLDCGGGDGGEEVSGLPRRSLEKRGHCLPSEVSGL